LPLTRRWYQEAVERGNPYAQNNIGRLYNLGRGVAQDYREAMRWFRRAADQGNAPARDNIGWLYEGGLGVAEQDVSLVPVI
jgi:TPR repeat protein